MVHRVGKAATRRTSASLVLAFGLVLAAVAASAADMELKPLGWELQNKSGYQTLDTIPASEPQLKFAFELVGDTSGKTFTAVWIAEDVGEVAPPNYEIDKADYAAGMLANQAVFTLSRPDTGWPIGKYRLEVRVGDQVVATQKFQIAKDS